MNLRDSNDTKTWLGIQHTLIMLKSLVESELFTDFVIIEDKEDVSGQNLFASFLENYPFDGSVEKINLICYENPPQFYIKSKKCTNEKIVSYNYFSHPLEWNDPSAPKTDLSIFLSSLKNLSETVFFIDSISTSAYYHGFYAMYKNLCVLKKHSKKIICVVHGDLFISNQLEELYFLASTYIKLQSFSNEKNSEEIICEVTHHKPGGKVIKQKEVFFIEDNFKITSRIQETEVPISPNLKGDIKALTTFKLGLCLSEEEKRARDGLILPYLKTSMQDKGEFIHQPLAHALEDDPDDDLDI